MILSTSDMPGSLSDLPEYFDDYEKNVHSFKQEFEELEDLKPGHAGWNGSLYFFKVYKGIDGYRVAMAAKYHPFRLPDRIYFEDYLLSRTLFPNPYQALTIASHIVRQMMGN